MLHLDNRFFQKVSIHGWIAHVWRLSKGKCIGWDICANSFTEMPNNGIWTKGSIEVITTAKGYDHLDHTRKAGFVTQLHSAFKEGREPFKVYYKALEDSEYFCFDARFNRGHLPTITPVHSAKELQPGNLFLASGNMVLHGTEIDHYSEIVIPSTINNVSGDYLGFYLSEKPKNRRKLLVYEK